MVEPLPDDFAAAESPVEHPPVWEMIDEHREVYVLVGLAGAGKSTAADIIAEEHDEAVEVHEMSDYVRDSYPGEPNQERYGGLQSNDNELGEWAAEKKKEEGQGYFAYGLAKEIKDPATPHVVISGVRSPAEAEAIKSVFGDVTTIGIWTLPDIRFKRKYGNGAMADPVVVTEFQERNERELWEWRAVLFFTEGTPAEADYIIANHDGLHDLRQNIKRFLKGYGSYSVNPLGERAADEVAKYL